MTGHLILRHCNPVVHPSGLTRRRSAVACPREHRRVGAFAARAIPSSTPAVPSARRPTSMAMATATASERFPRVSGRARRPQLGKARRPSVLSFPQCASTDTGDIASSVHPRKGSCSPSPFKRSWHRRSSQSQASRPGAPFLRSSASFLAISCALVRCFSRPLALWCGFSSFLRCRSRLREIVLCGRAWDRVSRREETTRATLAQCRAFWAWFLCRIGG